MRESNTFWVSELAGAALCCLAFSTVQAAQSLCAADEPVVFACHIGSKTVSLCRAGKDGPLSYRFGRPAAVELRYPAPGREAAAAFTVTTEPLIGGGETTVAFRRNAYTYKIYSKIGRAGNGTTPEFEDGIIVERGGKVLSKMVCEDGGEGFREPLTSVAVK